MTREQKLLVALGTALIVLMVAIASFSLGVYFGVHGWTAGAPAVAGPGPQAPAAQGQQAAALPAQAGQGAPAAQAGQDAPAAALAAQADPRPQLVGRVRTVDLAAGSQTLTLDTPQGPRLVHLATGVGVQRVAAGNEVPATLDEIQPGVQLAVFGRLEDMGGQQQFVARRLLVLPAAASQTQP